MMKKDEGPPVVTAVAVATPTNIAAQPSLYVVELPTMTSDLGFQVVGSPPRISNLYESSPLFGKVSNGHFIHGIVMPEITIDNLTDSNHLIELLNRNVGNSRSIIVSPSPTYSDPVKGPVFVGALYKHELPVNVPLEIGLQGFPPTVVFVRPNSPLTGRIHPGQGVHALVIPGQPIFNLQSGGFTHAKVLERLANSSHIEGRQLVVKDIAQRQQEKGSSVACDDCVIL